MRPLEIAYFVAVCVGTMLPFVVAIWLARSRWTLRCGNCQTELNDRDTAVRAFVEAGLCRPCYFALVLGPMPAPPPAPPPRSAPLPENRTDG